MPESADIEKAQQLVAGVFRELRPTLMSVFGNVPYTRKSDESPVTQWDVLVEETLATRLSRDFPGWGFEGEETGARGSEDLYWLVDPIDGTSSFIRGLHYSTNMAALIYKGEVIAAVIYDFIHDVMYTARKGAGAYRDGERLSVNTERGLDSVVLYSFARTLFDGLRKELGELRMRVLLTMGAAGHSYVMLAEGKIDGVLVIDANMGHHDNAPGKLIATEAGAITVAYDDKQGVDAEQFIIATPAVAHAIKESGVIERVRAGQQ